MYFITIDCGTTNSRVHILDEQQRIITSGFRRVGVRDTAISGSGKALRNELTELILETVQSADLEIGDIKFIITSGMITSEIGLLEVPHLEAPVSIDDLVENIVVTTDPEILPLDIPLVFIRGVKNAGPADGAVTDLRYMDFMRGEETQIAGLMSLYPGLPYPLSVVILSSHTKSIHLNKQRQISGSITNLSGQIYDAILSETSIGKSVIGQDALQNDYFDQGIVNAACDAVENAGFLRTLLMTRFMEILLKTSWYQRNLFLNAAISVEDLRLFREYKIMGFSPTENFVLVGPKNRCKILKHLLHHKLEITGNILCIDDKQEIDSLNIAGAALIAKKANLLEKIQSEADCQPKEEAK